MEKINTDYKRWTWSRCASRDAPLINEILRSMMTKSMSCTESLKFAIQSAKVECTWIPVSVEQHKIHAVTRNLRYDSLLRSRYLGRHATLLPPLVEEKRCVTTQVTAAEESTDMTDHWTTWFNIVRKWLEKFNSVSCYGRSIWTSIERGPFLGQNGGRCRVVSATVNFVYESRHTETKISRNFW